MTSPTTARYARQTVLPQIGPAGQAKLAAARVQVVGAGGLGAPVLLYLAAAGIGLRTAGGRLGVIDPDTVDLGNLQRQVLFTTADLDQPKATAAATRLAALNPDTALAAHVAALDASNALALLADYDVIVDGSDNFATKYLLNDACARLGKPLVYGSILGLEGQVAVFDPTHGDAPCYRCLFPQPPATYVPNCAEAGTIGSIAGLIGSLQANEAIKLALGDEHCREHGLEPLRGKLWLFDAADASTRRLAVARRADCPVCSRIANDPASIPLPTTPAAVCATTAPAILHLTLAAYAELAPQRPTLLLDVRNADEWQRGHLPDATHLPLPTILATPDALDLPPTATAPLLVLYCRQGLRSEQAAVTLRRQGYACAVVDAAEALAVFD
jgi:adenylyltransferase/sulfurtransferase